MKEQSMRSLPNLNARNMFPKNTNKQKNTLVTGICKRSDNRYAGMTSHLCKMPVHEKRKIEKKRKKKSEETSGRSGPCSNDKMTRCEVRQ